MKRALILTATIIALSSADVMAAQPVFDTASAAKLTQQINEMKKQLEVLTEANGLLTDQLEAVGAGTTIPLFTLDPDRLKGQITRGVQCLLPDLEGLMPNVEFDTFDIGDICQRSDVYRQTLTTDPDVEAGLTKQAREASRAGVRNRREAIFDDTVLKGLAAGDSGVEESQKLNESADNLSQEADAATNMNKRLAVIAKGQVLQVRAAAQTNQLLSQLLKQQSAWYAHFGMDVSSFNASDDEGVN